jgi:thiamine pyrophosphate-dependent acetolactate synthase large subunit-like protein
VWQTSLHNPDFAAYARDCGAYGIQISSPAELNTAIAAALTHTGPALVEILTDARSN